MTFVPENGMVPLTPVPPKHGPLCTIRDTVCLSFHCRWCGEVCSMMGCGCDRSKLAEHIRKTNDALLRGTLPDKVG